MVGRTPKYSKPRIISGYLDDDDLKFIDHSRGKISRMGFLIECMYAEQGKYEKLRITDNEISRLKAENHELKKQLLFEQSKRPKVTVKVNVKEFVKKALITLSSCINETGRVEYTPLKFHAGLCKVEPGILEGWVKQFANEWRGDISKIDAYLETVNLNDGVSA